MCISVIAYCLLMFFCGYLLGDLFSGIFHWWEDRYGKLDWPILGKLVVEANVEHHMYPSNTCRRTYWYRCGSSIIAVLPFVAICLYFQAYVIAIAFCVVSQANEVHAWAHQRMGKIIRFLQRTGVVLSPKHHAVHHHRPYSQRYCVITNWLNPILGAIGFWVGLQWFVWFLTGVRPNPEREIY